MAEPVILENRDIQLTLDVSDAGTPRIAKAARLGGKPIVLLTDTSDIPLSAWVPKNLVDQSTTCTGWQRLDHDMFLRAETSRPLAKGLEITWRVDLSKTGSLIRFQTLLTNGGNDGVPVEWFPIWNGAWQMDTFGDLIRYWDALSFVHQNRTLKDGENLTLASHVHSSDTKDDGKNPYWCIGGNTGAAYFGLEWCGGWQADLKAVTDGLGFHVFLPPAETQLVLEPGETIGGPVLNVLLAKGNSESEQRADWIRQRRQFSDKNYGGPPPSYPFTWNHWYSVRFDIDGAFFQRQIAAMPPYDFDYFIVDAGWYEACGKWAPDPNKFKPGEFQDAMAQIAALGVKPGIWTCPQFVHPDYIDQVPLIIDEPGFYRKFINGHLVDMAGSDFTAYLTDHVRKLRSEYHVGWWKYDQDFFTGELSRGRMRNVIALQDALLAVRKDQPDLYIENCQSGGRMINEFIVLLAQGQWIRDGGHTGRDHARSNLREALGALEFMPPWTIIRWINRPYDNDTNDDEFTRMYCRSAMAGVWGIVADLPKIPDNQRTVILEEIANYHRFNEIKHDNLYEIYPAEDGTDAAGVMYRTSDASRAAVLLLRWDTNGAFTKKLKMPFATDGIYRIGNADTGQTDNRSGEELRQEGLEISFESDQLSTIVFLNRTK